MRGFADAFRPLDVIGPYVLEFLAGELPPAPAQAAPAAPGVGGG